MAWGVNASMMRGMTSSDTNTVSSHQLIAVDAILSSALQQQDHAGMCRLTEAQVREIRRVVASTAIQRVNGELAYVLRERAEEAENNVDTKSGVAVGTRTARAVEVFGRVRELRRWLGEQAVVPGSEGEPTVVLDALRIEQMDELLKAVEAKLSEMTNFDLDAGMVMGDLRQARGKLMGGIMSPLTERFIDDAITRALRYIERKQEPVSDTPTISPAVALIALHILDVGFQGGDQPLVEGMGRLKQWLREKSVGVDEAVAWQGTSIAPEPPSYVIRRATDNELGRPLFYQTQAGHEPLWTTNPEEADQFGADAPAQGPTGVVDGVWFSLPVARDLAAAKALVAETITVQASTERIEVPRGLMRQFRAMLSSMYGIRLVEQAEQPATGHIGLDMEQDDDGRWAVVGYVPEIEMDGRIYELTGEATPGAALDALIEWAENRRLIIELALIDIPVIKPGKVEHIEK